MSTVETPEGTWSELLGPAHLRTSLILAGGVCLHAVNIFLTTSLLPSAIEDIGGEQLYAWSTTVFMIASVISSTLVSRILSRRGPTGAYLVAFTPFVVGTVLCAMSPTMELLLAGRAIQGFGGGMLAGLGYAVLQTAFPEHLWVRATALISAMWGLGTLAGPAIGGAFAQFDAWRYAFALLAAIAVVIAGLSRRAFPRTTVNVANTGVPWRSLALLTAATAAICVASILTGRTPMMLTLLVAASLFAAFVVQERTGEVQVLPASAYSRSPLMWIYFTIGILAIGTVSEAFTPLFGQRLGNLEPVIAGFLGAAVSLGWSATMIFSANASRPRTVRRLRAAGPLILAAGLAATGILQQESANTVTVALWFVGLVVAGSGIGLAFPHLVVAAMTSSPDEEEAGKAGAGVNTVELIAMAAGSALGGLLMNLGSPSMLHSSKYLLLGLAAVAALGFLTARRIDVAET